MRLITVLNELSHPTDQLSDAQARATVRVLIGVLKELKKIRPALELHTASALPSISLGSHRTLSTLRADASTREEWQFLRGLDNRAFDMADAIHDLSVDYEYEGTQCIGLGLAHALEALAVSFEGEHWGRHTIDLICRELDQDGEIKNSPASVKHVASSAHIAELLAWLRTVPLVLATNGQALWDNREEYFPTLHFLPRTRQQLIDLQNGSLALAPVNERLWQLEIAAKNWPANSALPTFSSKVTPEYEQRRSLCYFDSASSGEQLFDLHARYTPGAGRIHFWCNTTNRTIEIAHIGEKL
ncbi:hypothetical protein [Pseudomonas sp. TE50-2]|uniref:hypothetical protein n=1 Tax=Pseudomonas sp. TE50-2 TaxID=3142707 RepID=UPI0034650D9E